MTQDEAKRLVVAYLEGRITAAEEEALFDHITASAEGLAAFRREELAWELRRPRSAETEAAWKRFADAVAQAKRERVMRRVRRQWLAAAAVALLLIVGGAAGWLRYAMLPEQPFAMSAPMGGKMCAQLPDGTVVWLNAGSTLRYSSRFNADHRRVELTGEGYFEVAHAGGDEFRVSTKGYDVVVKGTKFDISAYPDDRYITTALVEGSVLVDAPSTQMMMKPGDRVSLDTRTGRFAKGTSTTDARAWIDNMGEYENISLAAFARIMERRYQVRVEVDDRLQGVRFSISLRNKEELDDVLDALQRVAHIKVQREGKTIYLR